MNGLQPDKFKNGYQRLVTGYLKETPERKGKVYLNTENNKTNY
jgi:hypothetical protein